MNAGSTVRCAYLKAGLAAALALVLGSAWADAVDDILTSNLDWRVDHAVARSKVRIIGGDGAPVGWYYLDLRAGSLKEVSIMSRHLGPASADLVSRIVRMPNQAWVFFNEDVYVTLDDQDLQSLAATGIEFWAAQNAADARAALEASGIYQIAGAVTKTMDGVTYHGIDMDVDQGAWDNFRAGVGGDLIVNLPEHVFQDVTLFFDPAGALYSVQMASPDVTVEVLFYDWSDISGVPDEIMDASRAPHAGQQEWDIPLDEATIKYIAQITK